MAEPLEMPPWMPPEWLVRVVRWRRGGGAGVGSAGMVVLVVDVVVDVVVGVGGGGGGLDEVEETATKGSLWMEPATSQPAKPEPISKPLVAGILSMA